MLHEQSIALSKFDLDNKNRSYLVEGGKLVAPLLPEVLDHFYGFISDDPEMSRFFPDQALIAKAKAGQKKHWELLLSGEFTQEYFDSAYRIGRIHPRIGLPFLFYLSGYAQATSYIQESLLNKYVGGLRLFSKRNLPKIMGAIARAFALDTHLVLDAHFAAEKEEQDLAFKYLTNGIQEMAARDLTQLIPSSKESDYPVRYDPVREAFNGLVLSQREVLQRIQESAANLSSRADEVAQSAEDLSHRTETQAATLEETAAAVEEISMSMQSAAEATHETNQTVSETRQSADHGSKVVQEAILKMHEIQESASEISQIINVIDDIAFQTNLLALNAGVEAARAGDAGRGFAVVASEVRGLAQRTAASANEIKSLIEDSTRQVEGGVSLVNETGKALEKMSGDVKRTVVLTSQVASSAEEQATGLSEINLGVSQLDQVTQQNAAMVEEATAAMLSMKQDVSMLHGLVGSFKIGDADGTPSSKIGSPEMVDAGSNLRVVGT
ncbi:methyl-accepting chemotaxis protein [Pseudophaeobacter sp.]|uniref:methyl-accepting chemotaxis protein n=1 Tax=Pseudophaeobacter sp. TaxID=1971739 RepID=UPI003A98455A